MGKACSSCCHTVEHYLRLCINFIIDVGFIILYIINAIFILLGAVIMIGSIYSMVEYPDWLELARQSQNVTLLLLMGIFTILVAVLGIVGACKLHQSDMENIQKGTMRTMYIYITCIAIITIVMSSMAIGMNYFMSNLNEPRVRSDGNHLENSFKHCDRYVTCSFQYCCDGLDGRAISGENVTCNGQEKATVYAMSKEKICGSLQKKNLLGGSSCSDYETYQVRVYDWVEEEFEPIVGIATGVSVVLATVFVCSVFVGACKKRIDSKKLDNVPTYSDEMEDKEEEKSVEDVRGLLKKESFKSDTQLAFVDSHGYSTVEV